MNLIEIVGRSLVVYAAVLVGLRLGGRRELGQLTPFDLVVILLVANAVQNAMVGAATSLQGGLVSAATLLAVDAAVARLRLRSVRVRQRVEGVPVVLFQHGELVAANLHREGITEDEIVAVLAALVVVLAREGPDQRLTGPVTERQLHRCVSRARTVGTFVCESTRPRESLTLQRVTVSPSVTPPRRCSSRSTHWSMAAIRRRDSGPVGAPASIRRHADGRRAAGITRTTR